MYLLILLIVAGGLVRTLAELEDRNGYVWGISAIAAGWFLSGYLGWFALASPAIVIVGAFLALWIAKAADKRRRGTRF